jgi:hypothetical protein
MKRSILLVNACVRRNPDAAPAERVLAHLDGEVTEINLERETLQPLNADTLALREAICRAVRLTRPCSALPMRLQRRMRSSSPRRTGT